MARRRLRWGAVLVVATVCAVVLGGGLWLWSNSDGGDPPVQRQEEAPEIATTSSADPGFVAAVTELCKRMKDYGGRTDAAYARALDDFVARHEEIVSEPVPADHVEFLEELGTGLQVMRNGFGLLPQVDALLAEAKRLGPTDGAAQLEEAKRLLGESEAEFVRATGHLERAGALAARLDLRPCTKLA